MFELKLSYFLSPVFCLDCWTGGVDEEVPQGVCRGLQHGLFFRLLGSRRVLGTLLDHLAGPFSCLASLLLCARLCDAYIPLDIKTRDSVSN